MKIAGGALPNPGEVLREGLARYCSLFECGMRNRIETVWNWGWSALTHDRAARIIIEIKRRGALLDRMYLLQSGDGGVIHGTMRSSSRIHAHLS